MQTFTQKTLTLAVLSGVLLAAAVAAAIVAQAQLKQARADAQQQTQAEASFTQLRADLTRWQKALASARSDVTLRQEPLDLTVALPPEQLYELPPILSKVFDPQGYFSLKQFKFEWKTDKEAGVAAPGPLTLAHITLQGDRTLILNAGKTTP
ncbi:MAG: hypothetical protein HHJ12_05705 [Glaciimonas sp.]|nr:hypothetical protein [Glaciimonas sp.]